MKYQSCDECGSQCCTFFGVPVEYGFDMYILGIPLDLFRSELDPDPSRYFLFHTGITITPDGKRFIVDQSIPVRKIETETGEYLQVESRCTMLNERGRCMIYGERPDMCRNFTAETAEYYIVPKGCKYEREKGKEA